MFLLMRVLGLLWILILGLNSLSAQHKALGGWYMYYGNFKIEETSLAIQFDHQYRNHFQLNDLDQSLSRIALQYKFNDSFMTSLGYAFVLSEEVGNDNNQKIENRVFQEVLIPQKIKFVQIQHRFRYEQRFIEGVDFKTRYRYSLAMKVPLIYFKEKQQKLYANVYNELFLNGEKQKETDVIFDRNRLYMGAGFKFNSSLAVQMGWMNQIFSDYSQPKLMLSIHHNLSI